MSRYGDFGKYVALSFLFVAIAGCTKAKLNNTRQTAEIQAKPFLDAKTSLTSIFPTSGSTAGGTILTMTGIGFKPGDNVEVGGQTCNNVVILSSSSITCTTSAHAPGWVDIVVTVNATETSTLAQSFEFIIQQHMNQNFAITSGGGISKGGNVMLQASIGEAVGAPNIQFGGTITILSGFQGVHWKE